MTTDVKILCMLAAAVYAVLLIAGPPVSPPLHEDLTEQCLSISDPNENVCVTFEGGWYCCRHAGYDLDNPWGDFE